MRAILAFLFSIASAGVAWGQGNPGFVQGATLCADTGCDTTPPINPFGLNQAFMLKQDVGTFSGTIPGLPNLTTNVQGTGFPGMNGVNWFLWNAPLLGTAQDGAPTLRVDRNPSGGGGTPTNVASTLWVNSTIPPGDNYFEWAVSSTVQNQSLNGQNIALAGSMFKQGLGVPVGPSWALYGQCQDQTGVNPPPSGCLGIELDSGVPGTVNGGTDPNGQRVIAQLVGTGASGTHVGYGVVMGANNTGVQIDRAFSLKGPGHYGAGWDCAPANTNLPCVYMSTSQAIVFDGTWTSNVPSFTRSMAYTGVSLVYDTAMGNVFSITDAGDTTSLGRVFAYNGLSVFNANTIIAPLSPNPTPDAPLTLNDNTQNVPAAPIPGTIFHLVGANTTGVRITYDSFGGQSTFTARRANGTIAAPTALLANQTIFTYSVFGYGATAYSAAGKGSISFNAEQNWTDTVQPTSVLIQTTPVTPSAVQTLAVKIWPSGGLSVGATTTDPGTNGINAITYFANGNAGVTCVGAPTALYAVIGGIVTHC